MGGTSMITVVVRTLFFYFFLICALKIMGKRQIGQLQLSEFVTTLLLSEIAADPITNPDVPLLHAIVPIGILFTLEILISFTATKVPKFKTLFDGVPSIVVCKGKLDQKQLKKNRISLDELLSEMRKKDIYDIADVEYAILEQNGQLSITPKTENLGVTKKDLNIRDEECGISHPIVIDGHIHDYNLKLLGKDHQWVHRTLKQMNTQYKKVFLFSVDDAGNCNLILKEK